MKYRHFLASSRVLEFLNHHFFSTEEDVAMHKLKYGGAGLRFMRYPAEMEIIVPDLGTHVCYACIFIHVNPGWRGHEFMKEAWDAVLRETQEPELDAFQALTGKACPAIIYRDTLLAFTNDCFFFKIIKTVVTERP